MNKINFRKRVLSLLSAGTIVLTVGACTPKKTKQPEKTAIVMETNTPKPTPFITPTITDNNIVTATPDIVETIEPTTSNTEEIEKTLEPTIETMTATPTEVATLEPTSSVTVKPTAVETLKPTATVTPKPTNNVTQRPTSTPTVKPTVKPTPVVTPKPTETPKAPKLTVDNINNIEAIDELAKHANRYVYNVNNSALFTYISYYYNGKEYICGQDEFRMFIALLNEQYLSEDTLKELFGDKSLDDIERCSDIFYVITQVFSKRDMTINYDQFIVDNNTRLFLNELQTKIKEYKKTGNIEEFNKFVVGFYEDKNLRINHKDNLIIDRYVRGLFGIASTFYDNIELKYIVTDYNDDTWIYSEYITNEFYEKTRNKQLTK